MNLNTTLRFILPALCTLVIVGCSKDPAYFMTVRTEPSTEAYAGTPLPIQPVFSVLPVQGTLANEGENFQMTAYLDPFCKIDAGGAFSSTAQQNVVSLVSGVVKFQTIGYWPFNHQEQEIYFRAKGSSNVLNACTTGVFLYQHFVQGIGNATSGVTGAAGGTGATEIENVNASVLNSQGLLIVAGNSLNPQAGTQLALWRYFVDGTIDTSFGGTGTGAAVSPATGAAGATGATQFDSAQAVQIDSQGRLIVVGTSANAVGGTQIAIWRFTADGILDTTFGTAGAGYIVSSAAGAGATGAAQADKVSAMQLDAQGNIVIVGTSKNATAGTELAVWRFTALGALDTTFAGGAGFLHSGVTGAAGGTAAAENDSPSGFKFDSTGNIVIAGSSANAAAGTEVALWRYTSAGVLDTTFGLSGTAISGANSASGTTDPAAELDKANAIQLDSQGHILLAGTSKNAAGGTELAIWRFAANGTLDTSFNTTGFVVSGTTGTAGATLAAQNDTAKSLLIDAQGNLVIAGSSANAAGGTQSAVWRYLPTGTIDTSFALNGSALFGTISATGAAGATGATQYDVVNSMIIDSRGRITLSGISKNATAGQELSLWRYLSTGILDI